MRHLSRLIVGALLSVCFVAEMPGQGLTPAPFALRSQQGQNVQLLSDQGTITFTSEGIGQLVGATVAMTYTGTVQTQINSLAQSGSTDFAVNFTSGTPPFLMNPGDMATFVINYNPSALGKALGQIVINFNSGRGTANLTVNLVGEQPQFGFSYAIVGKTSQTAISPSGSISFPDTTVNLANANLNQTNAATFVVTNSGSGPGTVNSISASGGVFTLVGVPTLPMLVQPATSITFTINFAPTALGSNTGTVRISFIPQNVTFNLSGNGVGAVLAYSSAAAGSTRTISNNDTITLPSLAVGDKINLSQATVKVQNTGTADGTVSAIASSDPQFALSSVPFLPVTLHAGDSFTFTITFTPNSAGTITALLHIDAVSFKLTGVGLGGNLTYAFAVGAATTTVTSNGNVILPPTPVAETSSAQFQVTNTGNQTVFINSISATGPATGVFTLASVPALPVQVAGGATVIFTITFAPIVQGPTTGALRLDNATFNLSGVATDPPPLPSVSFPLTTGAGAPISLGGSTDAAGQVSLGITLANPYPVQLDGKLVLTFASDAFSDDPAIQFSSGGRTVSFVVLANTTQAVFLPGISTQIRLQTGTVTGTITLSAGFVTDAGQINLTPTLGLGTLFKVSAAKPRIRSVQLSNKTTSSFTLLITGYAPSRSVSKMDFTFAPHTDPNNTNLILSTTSLSLPVDGEFSAWYQSTASQAFGSAFTATVTFNVNGDITAIQSVSATMTNALGTSDSLSVALQ
ncbi:MAG TPA: choice-of-anchor D domain-containing protein [Bryobacterales bacterium]|nr:choice-of-anchor D domain-containing protein [Bryobacterales bacterium]